VEEFTTDAARSVGCVGGSASEVPASVATRTSSKATRYVRALFGSPTAKRPAPVAPRFVPRLRAVTAEPSSETSKRPIEPTLRWTDSACHVPAAAFTVDRKVVLAATFRAISLPWPSSPTRRIAPPPALR
jgi:hypothetical protein